MAEAPAGYVALPPLPERLAGFDPIAFHAKRVGEALALGFRVGPQHLNPAGLCHGGVIATFCDVQLAFAVLFATPSLKTTILPTISLSLDYLAPIEAGAWVGAIGGPLAVTRNMAFATSIVTADGRPAARASGTFKTGSGRITLGDTGAWLRDLVDRP